MITLLLNFATWVGSIHGVMVTVVSTVLTLMVLSAVTMLIFVATLDGRAE